MTEQEFQIIIAAVRQQREAALDAVAQNAAVIAALQARVAELEAATKTDGSPEKTPPGRRARA